MVVSGELDAEAGLTPNYKVIRRVGCPACIIQTLVKAVRAPSPHALARLKWGSGKGQTGAAAGSNSAASTLRPSLASTL